MAWADTWRAIELSSSVSVSGGECLSVVSLCEGQDRGDKDGKFWAWLVSRLKSEQSRWVHFQTPLHRGEQIQLVSDTMLGTGKLLALVRTLLSSFFSSDPG